MNPRFTKALVTGASSGIGEAVSRLLATKKIPLILTGRNADRLRSLAEQLGSQVEVEWFTADLGDSAQRNLVIDKIHKSAPDLVINNAGFGLYGDILTHETEKQMAIFKIDAEAVLELSIETARVLVSEGKPGVVLNVSSAGAFQIFPSFAVYVASKAFVNSFSESFDEEVKPYGVRILAACPGVVSTRFTERAAENRDESKKQKAEITAMTSEFAAEEIWRQIEKGKPVHIFNWKYRFLTFITRLLPKKLVLGILKKSIQARHAPRSMITK